MKDRSNADNMRLRSVELDIQKCILDAIRNLTVSSPPGTGLATEVTLQTVSATLSSLLAENKLDFELMTVKDASGAIFKLRMLLDEETGIYTTDFIDATGSVATPGAGIVFLNPETLLSLVLTELQTLNTTDFATQTTLAALLTELQLKADLSETQPVSAVSLPLPTGAATEVTLLAQATDVALIETATTALNTKLNTLGQKLSAGSAPVVLSTEQEVILNAIKTAVESIDTDTNGLATEVTLAAIQTLITTIDTVLDNILLDTTAIASDTAALVLDVASIEVLLTTIDAVLDTIKLDTANLDVTLSSRLNTLGQKASALSAPTVLSTEQEAILLAIQTAVQNIDTDLGTGGLATETTLQAVETLVTSTNALLTTIDADTSNLDVALSTVATEVTLSAIETLLTTIDGVLDSIKVDTGALVVDLAAIEVLITTSNSLLTTIDGVLDAIKLDTAAIVIDVAAIEALLITIDTVLDAIAVDVATLIPTARTLTSLSGTGAGTVAAGQRAVTFFLDGLGGEINGIVRPDGWSQTFEFDNDTTPAIPYDGNTTCTIYIDYLT